MTDAEHVDRVRRIQAERVAAGREPLIQAPAVYVLLSAVIDAQERNSQHK
jgi:hypothetical protein